MSLMELVAYASQPVRVLTEEEHRRIIERIEAFRFRPRTPEREVEEDPTNKRRRVDKYVQGTCLTILPYSSSNTGKRYHVRLSRHQ